MKRLSVIVTVIILLYSGCDPSHTPIIDKKITNQVVPPEKRLAETFCIPVEKNVAMQDYFKFIDSLAEAKLNHIVTSIPKAYILVNANPWIIDSLKSMDYYQQQKKGTWVYDPTQFPIFHASDCILIPDSLQVSSLISQLSSSYIDVNIPEFKLRVIQQSDTILTCKIRVGQNKNKYLGMYEREMDLRTPVGAGEIIATRERPKYLDLDTGEEYLETTRDDGRRTKMPIMPSLELKINGRITGTLIHPTTNPKTLGKAYSNGCIGTSEQDIWPIYYSAPPGTKVVFRYDLTVKDEHGKTKHLRDIYYRDEKDTLFAH